MYCRPSDKYFWYLYQIIGKIQLYKSLTNNGPFSITKCLRFQIAYALNLHNKVKPKLNEFGRLKKEFQRRDSESGVDTKALGKELVEDLLKLANVTIEGKLFWLTDDQSLSRAVEITAYNTMSLIMLDKLPESLKVPTDTFFLMIKAFHGHI